MSKQEYEVNMLAVISETIKILPEVWEIPCGTFNDRLAKELNYSPRTIEGFKSKGITKEVSPQKLFPALKEVLLSAINDKNLSQEDAALLKEKYMKLSAPFLYLIARCYANMKFLKPMPAYSTDEEQAALLITRFIYGLWPENSEGLNKEETERLRIYLNRYPPKCVNPNHIIEIGNELKAYYGEIPNSAEECINKWAKEIAQPFFDDI